MNNIANNQVKLSIIIPTRKRIKELSICLDQLIEQITVCDEIIVSEDDETLESQLALKEIYPQVKWLAGPCKGPAANRNNGAKNALNDFLIFLDDDCIPAKSLIESYREFIQRNTSIDAIEGCIKPLGDKKSLAEECPANEVGGYFWSCNVLFKRSTFEMLGGFDEDFPFACMEDPEIYYRMKMLNMNVPFLPEAFVMHPWVLRKDPKATLHRRLSQLVYLSKHPEEKQRLGSVYFLRLVKNQIKQLLINGILRGHSNKMFFLVKILQNLIFAWIIRSDISVNSYVKTCSSCCSGCDRAKDFLSRRA